MRNSVNAQTLALNWGAEELARIERILSTAQPIVLNREARIDRSAEILEGMARRMVDGTA